MPSASPVPQYITYDKDRIHPRHETPLWYSQPAAKAVAAAAALQRGAVCSTNRKSGPGMPNKSAPVAVVH